MAQSTANQGPTLSRHGEDQRGGEEAQTETEAPVHADREEDTEIESRHVAEVGTSRGAGKIRETDIESKQAAES